MSALAALVEVAPEGRTAEELADELAEIDPALGDKVEGQLAAVPASSDRAAEAVSASSRTDGARERRNTDHWNSASTTSIGRLFCLTFCWQRTSAFASSCILVTSRLGERASERTSGGQSECRPARARRLQLTERPAAEPLSRYASA